MKYKLIATDIDDTLLRRDKTLSPVTKAALLQAQENGMIVAKPEVLSSLASRILGQIGKGESDK